MGKDKESLWETLQRAAIKIIEVPHRKIETSEMSEITLRYARWFDRKSASMPGPMKILQRRTLGTALQVIENVYDIPFEKMTESAAHAPDFRHGVSSAPYSPVNT